MAYEDHIVGEVRILREHILEQFQGKLDDFFVFIREEENKKREYLAKISPQKGLSILLKQKREEKPE